MTNGDGNWTIWLSRAMYNPWFRLVIAACGMAGVGVCVAMDQNARSAGAPSPVARAAGDLWLAIGFGVGLGVMWTAWEWVRLSYRREDHLAFHCAPYHERRRWKYQRPNLIWNALCIVATIALVVWCVRAGVWILLPSLAYIVPWVALWRPIARFGQELSVASTGEVGGAKLP